MLLSELLPRYLSANIKIRKQGTREHYERSVSQYAEYLGREPTLNDFNDDAATGFMLWTLAAGLSEVTANQRVKQIRALWEWAARRRYVEAFPTFKLLDEPEQQPIAYTPAQLGALFATCKKQVGYIGPYPADLWWTSQHWWYFATAERTSATLSVARDNFDLTSGIARVPAKIRKGGRKSMAYRLPQRLIDLLTEMFRYPSRNGIVWERGNSMSVLTTIDTGGWCGLLDCRRRAANADLRKCGSLF